MSHASDAARAEKIIQQMEEMLADKTLQSFGHGCLFRGDVRALVNAFRHFQQVAASVT